MSDFNYQTYLKNNPLLQKEVKENKLITESQEVEEQLKPLTDEPLSALRKMGTSDMNLWHVLKLIDAGILQDSEKNKALKALDPKRPLEEVTEEVTEEEVPSSKIKVSELKAKIKEDIISLLQEEEDEVDIEDEIEADDVEVDIEEPTIDAASDAGLSSDEQEIQDSLKLAYDNAVAIGDQKLADQIGNSITFFTRTHVVER
jgi:hypothetical protein